LHGEKHTDRGAPWCDYTKSAQNRTVLDLLKLKLYTHGDFK